MIITSYIKGQSLTVPRAKIVAGSNDYQEIQVVLQTADWSGLALWAHFTQDGKNIYNIEVKNCQITREQHLNLSAGDWSVYFTGLDTAGTMRITTETQTITVQDTGAVCGPFPAVPPSHAEQITKDAEEARKLAQQAMDTVTDNKPLTDRAEAAALAAETSEKAAATHAAEAGKAEASAKTAAQNAAGSEGQASQALADLLRMLGTDIATLVGGKIPMSQIPATATQEVYEIASEAELTGLVAQRADLAELIELVDGVRTVTKTWQLLGDGDAGKRENWIVWGTSYAVQAGNATTADNATSANTINGHRLAQISQSEWDSAVKDPDTYYLVYGGGDA